MSDAVATNGDAAAATRPPQEVEEEDLPFFAKVLNHILTPGSSLTHTTWVVFNILIFLLFLCWSMFLYAMPTNIHVWVFGFLGLGFAVTTNWFMKIVFSSGLDFATQQQQEMEEKAQAGEGNADAAIEGQKKQQ